MNNHSTANHQPTTNIKPTRRSSTNRLAATRLFVMALLIVCTHGHPVDLQTQLQVNQDLQSLNIELDQNELVNPVTLKFSADSLKDVTVKNQEEIELHCEAAGSPAPNIIWYHNGVHVQGSFEPSIYEKLRNVGKPTIQHSVTVSKYSVPCASQADAGEYKCVANNGYKNIEKTISVVVEENEEPKCDTKPKEPKLIQWTESRFENEGNSAQFFCRTNEKDVSVIWFNDDRVMLNDEPGFEVLENGDLMVKKATWSMMGTYTCIVSNIYGQAKMSTFFYPTALD